MSARSIFLALFIFLFTLNFTLRSVQLDTWAQTVVLQPQKKMTHNGSSKAEFSPLKDGFVRHCLTTSDSKSEAPWSYLLRPLAVIEIRHAPVYLLDACLRC
jgi:hypothetical protein